MKTAKLISTTFALVFGFVVITSALYGRPVIGLLILGLLVQGIVWGVTGIFRAIRGHHHRSAFPPS
jgi:hypothetical protein